MSGYVRLQSACQMFQVVHPMDVATLRLLQQNSEDPVRDLGDETTGSHVSLFLHVLFSSSARTTEMT